jgi:hypothetical protein
MTEMEIRSERVDDIPLIVEMLKQMKIAKWIDKQLKQPHGSHQGLSYGQLSVILLIYIISQCSWNEPKQRKFPFFELATHRDFG